MITRSRPALYAADLPHAPYTRQRRTTGRRAAAELSADSWLCRRVADATSLAAGMPAA